MQTSLASATGVSPWVSTQERYYALMDDQTALDALLQKGVDTAREGAAVTLRTAKERVGLWALPRVEISAPHCCRRPWDTEGVDAAPRIGQDRRCDRLAPLS